MSSNNNHNNDMPSSIHVVDGTTFTERRLSERESEADTTSIFSSEADEEGSNANNNEERSTAGRLSLWQNELYAPPKIFHAVWNHQWDYARFLLSKHNATSSLAHTDSYGYTPLHFACWEGAPASLLNEMLSKYAVAASRRNNKGRTPLHFACWRGTDECVNRLLKHRPDAASVRDNNGKSPLYDACTRNRSYDVLRALILADIQQSQVRSRWGYTPAAVLARTTHACTIVSHAALQTLQRCDGKKSQEKGEKEQEEEESDEDKEEKEYRICDIVSRISLLLHAELHNSFPLPPPPQLPSTKKNSSMMPPLSIDTALRSKSCPYALLLVALEYDRKSGQPLSQLEIPNNHGSGGDGGDYLLHTAAKLTRDDFPYDLFYRCDKCGFIPPREEERREEGKKFMYFNKDPYMSCYGVSCSRCVMEGLKMHYLEVEPVDNTAKTVGLMVDSFPEAANFPDCNGRLPMSLYIESGKHWNAGLETLFRASTRSIETRDVRTHMYPFMLAAAREVGRDKEEGSVNEERLRMTTAAVVAQKKRHNLNNGKLKASEWKRKSNIVFNLLLKDPLLVKLGL